MTISTYCLDCADKIIKSGNAQLAACASGSRKDIPVILIMGATFSMDGWPQELITALVDHGLYVVRFDHRDTGQSSTALPGETAYTVEDMAEDTMAVMDAYGLPRAHLVGMSLGGYIAQMIAARYPKRVNTVTLIGSEPLGWDGPALPQISQAFLDHFESLSRVDWTSPQAVAEFMLQSERLSAGSGERFDEPRARTRVERMLGRAPAISSMFNHASLQTAEDWTAHYRHVTQPVLVIHGEDDPILPVENGRALAKNLPSARLVVMPGVGHELPLRVLGFLAEQIAKHIGARARTSANSGR